MKLSEKIANTNRNTATRRILLGLILACTAPHRPTSGTLPMDLAHLCLHLEIRILCIHLYPILQDLLSLRLVHRLLMKGHKCLLLLRLLPRQARTDTNMSNVTPETMEARIVVDTRTTAELKEANRKGPGRSVNSRNCICYVGMFCSCSQSLCIIFYRTVICSVWHDEDFLVLRRRTSAICASAALCYVAI